MDKELPPAFGDEMNHADGGVGSDTNHDKLVDAYSKGTSVQILIDFWYLWLCHITKILIESHFENEKDRNLTLKVHLNDLFKLQDIYHYDLMYFNYEFDAANFYISGFE